MGNSRIALTLAGVFLAGLGTGMLAMRYSLREQLRRPAPAMASTQEAVLERFRTELNLSAEQTEKLAAVLKDYQHFYRAVEEQMEEMHLRDQIEDLRATGKNRILEILNAEQRAKFEQMTGTKPALDPSRPAASQ
jgi:Spy/CpxP family protein refolding chaperone